MTTKAVRKFLPPQHGAWAMLLLPWLAGTIIAGFRWLDVPLLLAWLTGYLASYYALLSVKTRRPGKVRAQLWLYGTPTVLLGALVLALRPPVLWYAPAYGLLLAVNVGYAARREDRALVNDLASVVQSCLMVFVCATVAAVPLDTVAVAFAALTAYFVGVVLHVKALIRERGNPRYRWASLAYHLAAFVASVWFGLALAIVFGLLAVRAWAMAGRKLRPGLAARASKPGLAARAFKPGLAARASKPGTLGIVEVIASLALLGALVVS